MSLLPAERAEVDAEPVAVSPVPRDDANEFPPESEDLVDPPGLHTSVMYWPVLPADLKEQSKEFSFFIELLLEPDQVVELRLPGCPDAGGRPDTLHGFFDPSSTDLMTAAVLRHAHHSDAVLYTLNPLKRSVLTRNLNRVDCIRPPGVARDCDVERRTRLPISISPVRPPGLLATAEQRARAYSRALQLIAWLTARGWPQPFLFDQGSGYDVVYRIDLPTDDGGLVRRTLAGFARKVDSENCRVDVTAFTAAHVIRLPQTPVAEYGFRISPRTLPNRMSGALEFAPEGREHVVTIAQLQEIAALAPATGSKGTAAAVPNLIRVNTVERKPVRWLWRNRIPLGRLTLVVGRPGETKTFFGCFLAAAVSVGGPLPDGESAPHGEVLLLATEDDIADTLAVRLDAAGADTSRVAVLKGVVCLRPDGSRAETAIDLRDLEAIRQALDQMPDCVLVIIDPIGSYLGAGVDAHRDTEVRGVLAPLAALASERNLAVILICHTRKAASAYADDAILGSRGFSGIARSVLHVGSDAKDSSRKLLMPGKNNLADARTGLAYRLLPVGDSARIEWESDPVAGTADEVFGAAGDGEGRTSRGPQPRKREEAADFLTELLRDGPLPVAEIQAQASAAGISEKTLRNAREQLGLVSDKAQFDGGWQWSLPPADDVPATPEPEGGP